MSISRFNWIVCAFALALAGCGSDGDDRFGSNISGLRFDFYRDDEGIHPSKSTLQNPRNPFRNTIIGAETKWQILAGGGNAGAFYAWAAILAREPTGEHQYYTATKLRDVYNANEVDSSDREAVRQMAIDGFQTVLDDFPDSVTFDASGTQAFRLATPALLGILDLNGDVEGDWVLVRDQNGELVAIKGAGVDGPPPGADE